MGKKKQNSGLAKALIKDRFGAKRKIQSDSHVSIFAIATVAPLSET